MVTKGNIFVIYRIPTTYPFYLYLSIYPLTHSTTNLRQNLFVCSVYARGSRMAALVSHCLILYKNDFIAYFLKYDKLTFSLITNSDVFNSIKLASELTAIPFKING